MGTPQSCALRINSASAATDSATCGQYTLHSLPSVTHQFVAVERRPVGEVLAMAFRERVTATTKLLGDEAAVGIDGVGDQQRSHLHHGTR